MKIRLPLSLACTYSRRVIYLRPNIWFSCLLLATASSLPSYAGVGTSVAYFVNPANQHDYGLQLDLPKDFGSAEFTLELWIRPDESFPVGPTTPDTPQQLVNWSDADPEPYSSSDWWFSGNFLLDGHNNNNFDQGTFSLQLYGGGRLRWDFGDGGDPGPGGTWAVQAWPATTTPSLLDGAWHQVTLVRRWSGATDADLELWIDGQQIATETSDVRTDMTQWWDTWAGFPADQEGWFWGAEKQAAIGVLSQYEDHKGPIDELRFWNRAKSFSEITTGWDKPVFPGDPGLVGLFQFNEGVSTVTCNTLDFLDCMSLNDMQPGYWSDDQPPLAELIFRDGFENGSTSRWTSSMN